MLFRSHRACRAERISLVYGSDAGTAMEDGAVKNMNKRNGDRLLSSEFAMGRTEKRIEGKRRLPARPLILKKKIRYPTLCLTNFIILSMNS